MYRLFLLLFLFTMAFSGCTSAPEKVLKIGVSQGPHQDIMNIIKAMAGNQGLTITLVPFSNYQDLNLALERGEIDANSFQTEAYLNSYNANNQNHLAILTKSFIQPMSVYAKTALKPEEIPLGASVAIPNDPLNGARALQLLAKAGLIELTSSPQSAVTLQDITANPRQLKVLEFDAPLIAQKLNTCDLVVCNASYAEAADLNKTAYRYATEDSSSPYTFVVVYRNGNSNPLLTEFETLFHSAEVKQYIINKYHGYVTPA